jgi:hypothetical protein
LTCARDSFPSIDREENIAAAILPESSDTAHSSLALTLNGSRRAIILDGLRKKNIISAMTPPSEFISLAARPALVPADRR